MNEETPAAPAQPAANEWDTAPAETSDTLDAFRAEQSEPAPEREAQPERQLSKRQRDINERARIATERATADYQAETKRLRDELAELRAQVGSVRETQAARPEAKAEARKKQLAELAKLADLPDAPKLEEFMDGDNPITEEQFRRYQLASAAFAAQKVNESKQPESSDEEPDEHTLHDIQNFKSQIDADFVKTLSADVKALRPIVGTVPQAMQKLAAATTETARTDVIRAMIARLIFASKAGRAHAANFSQHPELLAGLVTGPATLAQEPRHVRDKAHAQHIITQFNALEATLSAAPPKGQSPTTRSPISKAAPPPRVITTPGGTTEDDEDSAASRGDFESFRKHRADRLESRARR